MLDLEFEKKWSQITALNPGGGFEHTPELLMPKKYWSTEHIDTLRRGVVGWLMILNSEGIHSLIDFNEDQITATKTLYLNMLNIAEAAIRIKRDESFEDQRFDEAFDAYFPDGLFISRDQTSEAYRELILRPAGTVVLYREAMGQVEPVAEAIK
jgi:hypothetical protein